MAGSKFDELALQYVLAVDKQAETTAASEAAALIQSSNNTRISVGQWVSSINRWISPGAGSGDRMDDGSGLDQDLISRAKALDFLASTLEVLNRDTLRADQVKLLATFFGSLFSSDHRAGVAASAKALRQLTQMKGFQPALAKDIIQSISNLGDDFKLQTPSTRLEIFELFNFFFTDANVVGELAKAHGEDSSFINRLLDLCRNERDPNNLMIWFSILKTFIQTFSPSREMSQAVFKAFSAYYPISLRASTTPNGITADDLKRALRACFSADYHLADPAIPFLIGKLDQGDAVTVAVRVDILQTIEACLTRYAEPQKSVVPYTDSIWTSLKYEVRNGEVADTVEATLRTIAALTRRLDGKDLASFFRSAWQDLSDDLTNPQYLTSAGRLLVAISGASVASFDLATSQSMPLLQSTIKSEKSAGQQQDLLTIINSLLLVRLHLEYPAGSSESSSSDALFGDWLFTDVHQRLWEDNLDSEATPNEKNALYKKLMDGMASMVAQRTSVDSTERLCTDSTCELILGYLSKPAIICPLTSTPFFANAPTDTTQEVLQESAAAALTTAVPHFPEGFQQVLLTFLSTIESALSAGETARSLPRNIQAASTTLSSIVCSESASEPTIFSTGRVFTYTLLQGLSIVLEDQTQSGPSKEELVSAFISSIHLSSEKILKALARSPAVQSQSQLITKETFTQFQAAVANSVASPDIRTSDSLQWPETSFDASSHYAQLLVFYLTIVRRLYIRFTRVESPSTDGGSAELRVGLSSEAQAFTAKNQDMYLHHLGLLSASVVRALSQEEQVALSLDKEAFVLFQDVSGTNADVKTFSPLDEFQTVPLVMGILEGLYPAAIEEQRHLAALEDVFKHLTTFGTKFQLSTRAAMDNVLTLLSNKYQPKGPERSARRLAFQKTVLDKFRWLLTTEVNPIVDGIWQIRAFCSIVKYIAGDIARFQGNPAENELLRAVCEETAQSDPYGAHMASYLGLLASPKQCLSPENHAVRKRLSDQWIYHQAVQPYLKECFLNPPAAPAPADDELELEQGGAATINSSIQQQQQTSPRLPVNRAVATVCILQHLRHEHYAADTAVIVRVLVSKMDTLYSGPELEAGFRVLFAIMDEEPAALREHLGGFIRLAMGRQVRDFQQARTHLKTGTRDHALDQSRKLCLFFLSKLPSMYDATLLLPHRQPLLKPLSLACGDPMRELRRLALDTRRAWEALN